MKIYYVYVYLDPRKRGSWITSEFSFDHEPFYIGEGKASRKLDHLKDKGRSHKANRIREIISDNMAPIIVVIKEGLTKIESTDLETSLIKQLGTRAVIDGVSRGPLTNLRLYGKNGTISDETRAKMSEAKKGVTFSAEHRAKLSASRAGRSYTRQASGPLSEEHKLKLSIANRGKTRTEESRQLMSMAQTGRTVSEEHRRKISESCQGRESPNTKSWKIEFESGELLVVKKLRAWCSENEVIYSSLRNTLCSGTFYRGMKLLRTD